MTQADRLRRFDEIQEERAALESRLLHLDVEESQILVLCEHTTEDGSTPNDPFCAFCGGAVE